MILLYLWLQLLQQQCSVCLANSNNTWFIDKFQNLLNTPHTCSLVGWHSLVSFLLYYCFHGWLYVGITVKISNILVCDAQYVNHDQWSFLPFVLFKVLGLWWDMLQKLCGCSFLCKMFYTCNSFFFVIILYISKRSDNGESKWPKHITF
jgi:hypothetical protein